MHNSGISVVMPVYNAGRYLQTAVDSILQQSHPLLELIIVDDGSTDQAIAHLDTDDRVRCVDSPSKGIVPALNQGIALAKYPYIARMDGDDIAAPRRLATQLAYLHHNPKIAIAGAKVALFADTGKLGGGYRHYQSWINQQCTPHAIERNMFVESCIPHPTAMFHRDVIDALGGYHDTPWPEDYDLWCRAHLRGFRFGKPDAEALLQWRDYPERTSRAQSRYNKSQFLACKAHYLSQYLQQIGQEECVIWGTGPTGLKLHDLLEHAGVHVRQFIDVNPKLQNRRKRGKPIWVINEPLKSHDLESLQPYTVVAVAARGAREKIHIALTSAGQTELRHFLFAA
ncbi:glycosyl transferase [Arenicella chitinivorans]|uniref:Glycosyl transferase n=1 Tax=Arenicella chitinivorans TaxID=1329800 RepID=A0A918RSH9_9GAMM|nr:glycosyltransferase [Arenicella chitinivorans]GHA08519.1 glycosyl transferase [Arenicella chitinivorans]